MAKYLLLKHYRGAPAPANCDTTIDQWTPEEVSAHIKYMQDFGDKLVATGEFVEHQALSPEGTFVRYDGEGKPPVTDGPFPETKEIIGGFAVVEVETRDEALAWAAKIAASCRCAQEVREIMADPEQDEMMARKVITP